MKMTSQRYFQKKANTTEMYPKAFDSTEFEQQVAKENFENHFSSAEQVFGFDNVEDKFAQECNQDSQKVHQDSAFEKSCFKVKGSCRPGGPNSCRPCGPNSYRPYGPNFNNQSGRRDPQAVSFVLRFGPTAFVQQYGPVAFVQQFGPTSFVRNFGFRTFVQQFGVRTASEVFGFNAEREFGLNGFEDQQNGSTAFEDQYGPNAFEEQYGPNAFEEQYGPNAFEEQYGPNAFEEQYGPNAFEEQYCPNAFDEQYGPNSFEQESGFNSFEKGLRGPNSSQFLPNSQRTGNAQQCFVLFAKFEVEAEKSRTPQQLTRAFQRNVNGCAAVGQFANAKTSVNQKSQVVEMLQGLCRSAAQSCYPPQASQYQRKCQSAARMFQAQGTMTPTWILACQMAADPQCNRNGQFPSQVAQLLRRTVQEVASRAVAQTVVACENNNQTGAVAVAQNAGALFFFFTTSNNENVKEDFLRKTQGALRVVVQQCQNNFPGNFKRSGYFRRSVDQVEVTNACRACASASPSTLSEMFCQ